MGPLASHMVIHILLMNLVAPLAASWAILASRRREPAAGLLEFATAVQLLALWTWHAPPLLTRAFSSSAVHLLMYGSLFLSAVLFWWAVLRFRGARKWKPVVFLLATSKLYCLLAVLLVFAPRALYPNIAPSGHGPFLHTTLADQQLAGLIMLVVCPATYLVAGIAITARWLCAIEADETDRPNAGEAAWT
ncbi:MAG TPA: cytochrome c oxidase assembly protein [Sinorhizobium sp.]|nr:cytochrome c oxidase assembly protein [Sinorhizobium sp.]